MPPPLASIHVALLDAIEAPFGAPLEQEVVRSDIVRVQLENVTRLREVTELLYGGDIFRDEEYLQKINTRRWDLSFFETSESGTIAGIVYSVNLLVKKMILHLLAVDPARSGVVADISSFLHARMEFQQLTSLELDNRFRLQEPVGLSLPRSATVYRNVHKAEFLKGTLLPAIGINSQAAGLNTQTENTYVTGETQPQEYALIHSLHSQIWSGDQLSPSHFQDPRFQWISANIVTGNSDHSMPPVAYIAYRVRNEQLEIPAFGCHPSHPAAMQLLTPTAVSAGTPEQFSIKHFVPPSSVEREKEFLRTMVNELPHFAKLAASLPSAQTFFSDRITQLSDYQQRLALALDSHTGLSMFNAQAQSLIRQLLCPPSDSDPSVGLYLDSDPTCDILLERARRLHAFLKFVNYELQARDSIDVCTPYVSLTDAPDVPSPAFNLRVNLTAAEQFRKLNIHSLPHVPMPETVHQFSVYDSNCVSNGAVCLFSFDECGELQIHGVRVHPMTGNDYYNYGAQMLLSTLMSTLTNRPKKSRDPKKPDPLSINHPLHAYFRGYPMN